MKLTSKMDTCDSLGEANLLDLFSQKEKEDELHGESNAFSTSIELIYNILL